MTDVPHPPHGGQGPDPSTVPRPEPAPLDLGDCAAVRAWLAALETQIEDVAAAGEDATRPLGQRDLGRRVARRLILDARASLRDLARALRSGLEAQEP